MDQPILEHARVGGSLVILAPATPELGRAIHGRLAGAKDLYEWLHWDGPVNEQDMAARWGDWRSQEDLAAGVDYVFALLDPQGGAPVGELALCFRGHNFVGDLAYWILPEFQGAGLGKQAVGLAIWLAFEHLGASLLTADVIVGNERSAGLLSGLGFRKAEEQPSTRQLAGSELSADRPQWTFTLGRRSWLRRADATQPKAAEVR
ncbi:MAG: RimJ/RimL family protein N-acetyltransferase [Planctomycetota bacterium]|jgi:RimJ/RimL family protein N-acetyltransferase